MFALTYPQIAGLFDFLSAGVVMISPERVVLHMNRTAEMLTESLSSEVIGKPCWEVFGDYLCDGDCLFDQAVARGAACLPRHLQTAKDTGHGDLTKMVSPLYDTTGSLTACLEIFQDSSAFSELIERLGDESRKMRKILDLLDIGVLSSDSGGHITFFNAMAETITGFRRQELLGKVGTSVLDKDFCAPLVRPNENDTPPDTREVQLTTRDGRHIPVQAKYIPLRTNSRGSSGTLTTFADLSLVYQYRNVINDQNTFYDMVSSDPKMQRIVGVLPAIAESDSAVLIEGPTGTGKDLVAKILHTISPRGDKPLVKVNCAALPDNLLESEMFGYVRGAFTGANRNKPGRFQEADGGTLFLDEIGDMPLPLQAKLLRVLEDHEFYPLGSRKLCRVDVRILSATNRDLSRQVEKKQFREDLFYRINVVRIDLPALKDRRSDLPMLMEHILKKLCTLKAIPIKSISQDAWEVLLGYHYPGNIRELENILEHALIISRGSVIDSHHLPATLSQTPIKRDATIPSKTKHAGRSTREQHRILTALEDHNWHKGQTAASLGMNRTTLWRKMKKLGIDH